MTIHRVLPPKATLNQRIFIGLAQIAQTLFFTGAVTSTYTLSWAGLNGTPSLVTMGRPKLTYTPIPRHAQMDTLRLETRGAN